MSASDRRLLLVHAHPDDECISTGGTIARYSAEGAHVCLVTCTNGELGEIADVPELGDVASIQARLGEVRVDELREACSRLGEVDLRLLGYHDSGMEGTPENADPGVFINQPLAQASAKIADVLRDVRPQVLVTYNDIGFYGHPDHIRAHQAAMAAVDEASGDHQVAKVYHTAIPRSLLLGAREASKEMGLEEDAFVSESDAMRLGTPDELITTELDVKRFVKNKFAALEAHRTQLGTTKQFFELPEDVLSMWLGTEYFVLARSSLRPPEGRESDLFDGIDA